MSEIETLSHESMLEGYHRRFEAVASALGDSPAIRFGEKLISYRALNYRANQLAHAIEQATDAKHIITLVSDEMLLIPVMLAIAKLGRVWILLSNRMPAFMISHYITKFDDAAFFTDQKPPDELQIAHPIISLAELALTDNPPAISKPFSANANVQIFPSLSLSGTLKAIARNNENVNRNLLRYVQIHDARYRDQIAFAGDPSFVGNLVAILTSLIAGATLHIINLNQMSLGDFHQYLREQRISSLHTTPSVFRLMFAHVKAGDFPDLRLIRVGGEAAFKADLELFKSNFAPPTKFVNDFGSTEVGAVSFFVADHETTVNHEQLPIGRLEPYLRLEIINDAGESVVGEEGEMVIYDKLLQSYWNEAPEANGKFFRDPKNPEWMGYRSGDYGILLEDGNLLYLGRRDTQLKVRGQRVDIAAIEKRFREHPALAEVLVQPYESKNETRLVAYLLAKEGMPLPNDNVWRAFLGQTLSDYMIPSRFVVLKELPRLANGKIDTKALPNPVLTSIERQNAIVSPRTEREKQLLAIWQDILDFRDEISIEDSFFDLGGSSLQATALISDVNERFNLVLTPAILYQFPSIQELAALIDENKINTAMHPSIVPFRPFGSHYPIFCLPGSLGNPLAFKVLAHRLEREYPIYGLQMQGLDAKEPLPSSLDELLDYYKAGIKSLGLKIPIYLMGLSVGGLHAFELARRLEAQHIAVEAVILLDTYFPHDEQEAGFADDEEEAATLQNVHAERRQKQRKQRLEALSYRIKTLGQKLATMPKKAVQYALLSPEARKARWEARQKSYEEARLLDERAKIGNLVNMNQLLEDIRKATRKTTENYRPEIYSGNVFYIKASHNAKQSNRADLWAKHVEGHFTVLEVDAPHNLLNIAHVDKVVKVLKEAILL
jgi:acyl-coenzyme A synthetase/AMP-(fatty) acid ligase/thioesterase domain-containing protein/acyl carrier protein